MKWFELRIIITDQVKCDVAAEPKQLPQLHYIAFYRSVCVRESVCVLTNGVLCPVVWISEWNIYDGLA
jgi:hypothetical protein